MEYPKTKSAEEALSHSMMYLFQAYSEEQGIESSKAKTMVIEKVLEHLQRYEGEKKSGLVKTNGTNFAIKNIKDNIKSLKLHNNPQIKYLASSIELNFDKLLQESKLI